jgi:hypothetical protein
MIEKSKSFCVLPFMHLATHPLGTVTPCCIADMNNGKSSAKNENESESLILGLSKLDQISNAENFKKIRKKMISGEYPSECSNCFFHEKSKIFSKRMESNLKFSHLIDECLSNSEVNGSLKEVSYKYIELRLGTVCNLKCVTCNPFSSSRWGEDTEVFKNTQFEKEYFKCDTKTEWFRDIKFYDELFDKCGQLEEVWINGGEPTLIREHAHFLQRLIDSNMANKITLQYSINMTDITNEFIDVWKKFKSVKIHMSIDDIGARNDYIRYGSKWNVVIENFLKLLEYKEIFKLEICQTISAYNVFNINNFKKYFLDYGIFITQNYVNYPSFQHVSVLPEKLKIEIFSNLENLRADERSLLHFELFKEDHSHELNKFIEFVKILDKKRKVNIAESLPEWKKYV